MDVDYRYRRQVALWLLVCAAVVFGMIVLGGVTRLTGSGLSMVEWRPLMGVIPPLSEAEWMVTFEKYKLFPEYKKVNYTMDLDGFKNIFYFEYFHRVLGRLIGVIFFFPMLYFWWRKRIPQAQKPQLLGLFVLGGLQGLMGWYMVKSGLVDFPRVSQYRLTAHLGLAVIIYAAMVWVAFELLRKPLTAAQQGVAKISPALKTYTAVVGILLFFMILSGGLVSGIRAGFAYNTFPLMDGRFFPVGLYGLTPAWTSIFEDITTVQFNHRIFAYLMTVLIVILFLWSLKNTLLPRQKLATFLLLAALVLQVCLGISTLLLIVPVPLAAAHQGGAIVLLTALLFYWHSLRVS